MELGLPWDTWWEVGCCVFGIVMAFMFYPDKEAQESRERWEANHEEDRQFIIEMRRRQWEAQHSIERIEEEKKRIIAEGPHRHRRTIPVYPAEALLANGYKEVKK